VPNGSRSLSPTRHVAPVACSGLAPVACSGLFDVPAPAMLATIREAVEAKLHPSSPLLARLAIIIAAQLALPTAIRCSAVFEPGSIVVASLQEVDAVAANEVDKTMFLCNAA